MNEEKTAGINELGKNTGISTCITTCEKNINNQSKLPQERKEANKIKEDIHTSITPETIQEKNYDNTLQTIKALEEQENDLFASYYLNIAKEFLPNEIVSDDNFNEIQQISRLFPNNLTTFLGFETRLAETSNRADFAFAISGIGNDRDILKDLFINKNFRQFLEYSEWQQISNFANEWSNKESELNDKIQCFWLEFDMPEKAPTSPLPSVFFGPSKIAKNKSKGKDPYKWITDLAIPLLKGQKTSKKISDLINDSISKMPDNGTIFQIGTMLSRKINAIRIHINKLRPDQIVPYLKDIGLNYDTSELEKYLKEFEELADRFVVSFDITENGIGDKIGIELSFISNDFNNIERWGKLLDYLVEKNMCLPEKKEALIKYSSVEEETVINGAIMRPIASATLYENDLTKSNVVRYINHIKIVYKPGKQIIAKAYPALRLFENEKTQSKMMN